MQHAIAGLILQQGLRLKIVQAHLEIEERVLTHITYSHMIQVMQAKSTKKMDELLTPIEYREVIHSENLISGV